MRTSIPGVATGLAWTPVGGDIQFGYTTLFSLPANGVPQPLFKTVQAKESYFDPTWSPDGKWLYYVHLTTPVTQTDTSRFDIVRLAYPAGQPAVVVRDAFWPRVSPDGQHLASCSGAAIADRQTFAVHSTRMPASAGVSGVSVVSRCVRATGICAMPPSSLITILPTIALHPFSVPVRATFRN